MSQGAGLVHDTAPHTPASFKPQSTFAAGLLGTVRSERHLDEMTPESLQLRPVNLFLGAEAVAPISLNDITTKRVNTMYANCVCVREEVGHPICGSCGLKQELRPHHSANTGSFTVLVGSMVRIRRQILHEDIKSLQIPRTVKGVSPLEIFVPAITSSSYNPYSLFQVSNAVLTKHPKQCFIIKPQKSLSCPQICNLGRLRGTARLCFIQCQLGVSKAGG